VVLMLMNGKMLWMLSIKLYSKLRHGPLLNYLLAIKQLVVSETSKSNIKLMEKLTAIRLDLQQKVILKLKG
jgi:hypothetical protein